MIENLTMYEQDEQDWERTEEWFDENFTPIKNHLDDNASWDGSMFETYGEEVQFVLDHIKEHGQGRVWTYQDNDDGDPCLGSGFHYVNRIGYIITEESWDVDGTGNRSVYVDLT